MKYRIGLAMALALLQGCASYQEVAQKSLEKCRAEHPQDPDKYCRSDDGALISSLTTIIVNP